MSVSNQTNRATGSGNGTTTVFSYSFKVFDVSDLYLYTIVTSTSVVTGPLTYTTQFTATINPVTEGGTITFVTPPPTGTTWLLRRIVPYTQTAVIPSEGEFPGKQFENQLDLMTMMIIQSQEVIDRCLQLSIAYTGTLPITFPLPAANQVLGWDPTGTFLKNLVVGGQGPTGPAGPTGPKGDTGAAGTGSVNSVTSANGDISVATTTTTPVLTLNSGVGANKIVKLDGSGKLPAVDGSQLTNLPASTALFVPNNIQVFTANGTWTKPAGVGKVYVKVWGAGASGGDADAGGGGGGGGGYAEGFTAVTGDVTVTVGVGGTGVNGTDGNDGTNSSFAGSTTITGAGGSKGTSAGAAGAGGSATNGAINISGSPGGARGAASCIGGYGGGSFSSPGGRPAVTTVQSETPPFPGAGSAGGFGAGSTSGAGASGMVIVYY